MSAGTGMKVPWWVNMDTRTCLATCALPRRLSRKPDQCALRLLRRCGMSVYRLRAAASGSVLRGTPRCVVADPAALIGMPVAASGLARYCKDPTPLPVDCVCILAPVAWK
jgi:hypothetical protein